MSITNGKELPIFSYPIHNRLVDVQGRANQAIIADLASIIVQGDLRILVSVLSHVDSGSERLLVTSQLLSKLVKFFAAIPNIEFLWSVQGGRPKDWDNFAVVPEGTRAIIHKAKYMVSDTGERVACYTGKTEHLLMLVRYLIDAGYPVVDTFLVTLDDDYAVYDAINVLGLFAPWVLSRSSSLSGPIVGFTKGGGARIVPPTSLLSAIANGDVPQLTYGELCKDVACRCGGADSPFLERDVVTPEYLASLDGQVTRFLRQGLRDYCRSGSRNSRALSVYLASRDGGGIEEILSRFSFLLHGDQGATLQNWASLQLGRGFALELTFLVGALTCEWQNQIVGNVITLPHAHFPRDDVASFELGVEMFRVLSSICQYFPIGIGENQLLIKTSAGPTFYTLGDFFVTQEVNPAISNLPAMELLPQAHLLSY